MSRASLIGRSNKYSVLLEKVVQENSLNISGHIGYNKFGKKDGIGFTSCGNKFIDNFLVYVYVPDYFVTEKKKSYTEVGSVNKHIRELLTSHGLKKCIVTAVALTSLQNKLDEAKLNEVYGRIPAKETEDTQYYTQQFKIACMDENYSDVLTFIRSGEYCFKKIYLKDIDITMDYSGSFNREEVIQHMVNNEGFRIQGDDESATRTIIDNINKVGNNCLTYMETIMGMTTRCKIYNKMVQMLESKSVRDTVGQHWKDWVCQSGTRLAKARDISKNRGLTRAEVTFYCKDSIPSDEIMEQTLERIIEYVPTSLVYSTPYACTWKAYCDCMLHSLVVVDRTRNTGLLVYTYNEITKNISGHQVEKWSEKEMWCLANLTLGSKLPIDLIEVCDRVKTASGTKTKKKTDVLLDITISRYFKSHTDGSVDFQTRLVSKKGVYCWNKGSKHDNMELVKNAGLVPHDHCVPYVAHVKGTKNSKVDVGLTRADQCQSLKLPETMTYRERRVNKDTHTEQLEAITKEAINSIIETRRPFEQAIAEKRSKLEILDNYTSIFLGHEVIPLKDLPLGFYNVMAMRETQTQFGLKYIMLVDIGSNGTLRVCYSNKHIEDYLLEHLCEQTKEKIRDPKRNYLTLYNEPLATLTITGWGRTKQNNVIVYCNIRLAVEMTAHSIKSKQKELAEEIADHTVKLQKVMAKLRSGEALPFIARENMVPYKHLPNLAELPLGAIHTVKGVGYSEHYGQQKLVVQLDTGETYQAGDNVERQKEQLRDGCKLVLIKTMLSPCRKKYAICKIVQQGDWAGVLDYSKVPLLPVERKRGYCKVVDVKSVEHKGEKRKLVLTSRGVVYKIKKSNRLVTRSSRYTIY